MVEQLSLSPAEAADLYRLMRYDYLSFRDYPALRAFWERLEAWADVHEVDGVKTRVTVWRVP